EDGIRDYKVTGVQTCALPISARPWAETSGSAAWTPYLSSLNSFRQAIDFQGFDTHPSGVIDPGQQQRLGLAGEVLVDRPSRALPMAVVIDDQHASPGELGVEMYQLVPSRLEPVGVQPQHGNLARRLSRTSLL